MADRTEPLLYSGNPAQAVDWDAIYTAELPRLYNYFRYRLCERDCAEELTAATFERAWRGRSRYRAALASLSTWLLGIARNVWKEHLRERRKVAQRLAPDADIDPLPCELDVEQQVQKQQDRARLQDLLAALPEREQDLIALKYGAGLTNRQIARVAGLSESNVGSILHRTVKSLREKWEPDDGR
jgi:RNA polymerase sigma-70 factor (ECF subfamily)